MYIFSIQGGAFLFDYRTRQAGHSIKKKSSIPDIYIEILSMESLFFLSSGRRSPARR